MSFCLLGNKPRKRQIKNCILVLNAVIFKLFILISSSHQCYPGDVASSGAHFQCSLRCQAISTRPSMYSTMSFMRVGCSLLISSQPSISRSRFPYYRVVDSIITSLILTLMKFPVIVTIQGGRSGRGTLLTSN